ncbi:BTB/POZ domain-containing protein 6 [Stylophora pistillata]|uniref:BTB/POZ domain-containing protein 6 n=2 Tax=Stylophora pistillata TaxID=50429 RepID=A0A2B4RGP5_STYPI|nr:BTB/POZ domain-containing protein 6 [Stylophora pistillata]
MSNIWLTAKASIRDRIKFVFNNDLLSDVKFIVWDTDGESRKRVIPGHKFVLSISSPVFEAMFYGDMAETGGSIELPDCEYTSLLELFRYIYSDEVFLSEGNVLGVLYLAKKYMVPSLADKCTNYLQDKLDVSNVFRILPIVEKFQEGKLVNWCWNVVDEQARDALKSDSFMTIERSLLEAIVSRDTLNIKEVDLFKAVDLWATRNCRENGSPADGGQKRRTLGEQVVKAIRFPIMKQNEFADVVLNTKILTQEEVFDISKYFNRVSRASVGFPLKERLVYLDCCRFRDFETAGSGHHYTLGKSDCLLFTVDKDIFLLGVRLCGSENHSNEYSVTISIKNLEKCSYLNSVSGIFSSVLTKLEPHSFYGFKILFADPVVIKKGVKYRIEAAISGANSCFGMNGQLSVV